MKGVTDIRVEEGMTMGVGIAIGIIIFIIVAIIGDRWTVWYSKIYPNYERKERVLAWA